jgi:hypothetical protein
VPNCRVATVQLYRLGGGAAEGRGAAHYRAGRPPRCGDLSPQAASSIQQPRRLPVLACCRQPLQPSVEPLCGFLQVSWKSSAVYRDLHLAGWCLVQAVGTTHQVGLSDTL